MRAGPGRNLIVAGAVLLVLGLVVGLTVSFPLGVVLILASLGAFGYQAVQSGKAAREREAESSASSEDGD